MVVPQAQGEVRNLRALPGQVQALEAVYGPYTGTCFASTRDTDIDIMD